MLVEHGLENKILSFTSDNATSNDKQTDQLHDLPNSFESINHVCCFNHMIQVSARAVMKPFCVTASNEADDAEDEGSGVKNEMPGLEAYDEEDGDPEE